MALLLAALEGVERHSKGDRNTSVDAAVDITAELEDVAVTEANGPPQLADLATIDADRELEQDRDELAIWDEVDRPAEQRHGHAPLLRRSHELLVRSVDTPGRPDERDAEDLLERADALAGRAGHVVAPPDVEDLAALHAEELLRLRLVGEEPDVFLDGELLLPHECDRLPRARPV